MKRYSIAMTLGLQLGLAACDSSSSSSNQPPVAPTPTPTAQPTPTPTPTGEPDPGNNKPTPPGGLGLQAGLSLDRSRYLQNIGSGVTGLTDGFRLATEQMATGVRLYCGNRDAANLQALQTQFAQSMFVWQQLELFQIGPMADANKTFKTRIYGWPQLANYCKIDEEAMIALEDPAVYELPSNANRKGLQALEYLIFDSSLATICPSTSPTKADWEALPDDQKWAARCAYMIPVADELFANAGQLASKWGTVDNNVITSRLGNPALEQAMLQELFNNLFYLDLEMKNQKLAAPAGQDIKFCNKTPNPCPDKEELRFSHLSKAALVANFRSLADIIFGFGAPRSGGMSALVRHEGGAAVADKTEQSISGLVTSSEEQTANLDSLVAAKANEDCETSQVSWLCQVRQSIRTVVADFKGEYASVLKTQVPAAPQGDND